MTGEEKMKYSKAELIQYSPNVTAGASVPPEQSGTQPGIDGDSDW